MLVESDLSGPVNISSGSGTSLEEFAKTVARILGYGADAIKLGRPDSNANEHVLIGNSEKLRSATQWRPAYSLEEGLEQTLGGYGAHTR